MLNKSQKFGGIGGPVVVIVMDGVGVSENEVGNAVKAARTPVLDKLKAEYPYLTLKAHGTAVGMPSDGDMGNSEVGHNAIGAGQVYNQGAALVADAISEGSLFAGQAWQEVVENVLAKDSVLHLMGLFSDGNVHSHIDHLKALIVNAKVRGIKTVRVHALLDGRDVPETSALEYTEPFEAFMAELNDDAFNVQIASGGGRQNITMDRYEANWSLVEKGWQTHVLGEGPQFATATEAVNKLREQNPGTIDQDLPPFVIAKNGKPVGTIEDGDSVVFYNFRGDRAIEITLAFTAKEFDKFDRVKVPDVVYAGMLQYDGDLQIPERYLVSPPSIKNTMGEWLAKTGVTQFACSETQKYGHVTYFWNGNKSGKFNDELETYVEVPSDVLPFEQRPWMKCAQITDELIKALESGKYDALRINWANGDMVGHTGNFQAAVISVEAVDLCLERLLPVLNKVGGLAIITADHGNADEMFELKKGEPIKVGDKFKAKTSHTLNRVPCYLYGPKAKELTVKEGDFGLSAIAATVTELLGYEPHESWDEGFLKF